jgi:hypothetical protein
MGDTLLLVSNGPERTEGTIKTTTIDAAIRSSIREAIVSLPI